MAEALPSVVVKEMLSKVLSLAADEVSLAWGFEDELKRLEGSLEMVQALLSDAAANRKTQLGYVGIWRKKLNDVAYDADAALDEFKYETLRQKVENRKRDKVRALFSPSRNALSFRLNMAHKIRNINESLDEIYKEGTRIGLIRLVGVTDATFEHSEIRLTHPYVDVSEVVGRDNDVSKIVDMLCSLDNEKHLSVMAIVGMGGQGKITLAQLVCKHDKVVRHFNEIIWACVSEDFEVTRLLNEMVQSLTGKSPQLSNVEGIIKNELGERLKGKRYMLVLDDVWNQDQDKWDCLRKALVGISGSSGSRIMVTTRSAQVASNMQASVTHSLRRLPDEDSWTMFKQRAFAEGGAVETSNLVGIGREIVKRCDGLPLAIKAL